MRNFVYVLILSAMISTIIGKRGEREASSLSSDKVNGPKYKVVTSKYKTKLLSYCRKSIVVSGKGIGEEYSVPCSLYGLNIITTDRVLVVRNRDKRHPLVLYSDSPSILIDVINDKCTKNTYKTVKGKTISVEEGMDRKKCNDVLQKVLLVERKAKNPYKEARRKVKFVFQKMFPPEFFEALKTEKYIEEVYSPGWNSWGL